ncbi:Golgi to ER traffic protein 4 homolog [Arctopsyche grandis]|uniref:Golgi to ER traffic protein 4 homolog n=1 Tax=Arctopsyche grandis TaxID=121162 RepID=UPI00406D7737
MSAGVVKGARGAPDGGAGLTRVRAKLSACLDQGNYYEAHQMYRTLHFRLLSKKSYNELLDLLYSGAIEFLKRGQQQSGVDIGILYVDVLSTSKSPVDVKTVEKISDIFMLINASVVERETFLSNSIRWSMGETSIGDPLLHKNIALALWKEKNYPSAQQHFFHSNDGLSFAAMLVEMHKNQGSESDIDIYIASAVLQVLCRKKQQLARDTFLYYVGLHPTILNETGPPFMTELLNFIWFLLQAVETKKANVFNELLVTYDESINQDPSYSIFLRRIGKIWFDIMPQKTGMHNGILGNLFQFLSNMEADDNLYEEEPVVPAAQNRMLAEDVE